MARTRRDIAGWLPNHKSCNQVDEFIADFLRCNLCNVTAQPTTIIANSRTVIYQFSE